jgi:hypothetical protein
MQRLRWLGSLVVEGSEVSYGSVLEDRCFNLAARLEIVDGVNVTQHVVDSLTRVTCEVGADPTPEIGCLSDVDRCARAVPERVHARLAGELLGQCELADRPCPLDRWKVQQVVEMCDTDAASPFEKGPKDMGGGQCVVEGAMARCYG